MYWLTHRRITCHPIGKAASLGAMGSTLTVQPWLTGLADRVGKSTALLEPLADAISRHVLAGQAIFADDTPVKMLTPGTGKTATARLWPYGRDERLWGSSDGSQLVSALPRIAKDSTPKDHLAKYQGGMQAPSRQIAMQSVGRQVNACIHRQAPAGQWTGMPGSRTAIAPAISMTSPAWPMLGVSSSTSTVLKARPSQMNPSSASRNSTRSRKTPVDHHQISGLISGKPTPNRSSTSWKPGCTPNSAVSLANRHWLVQSAML